MRREEEPHPYSWAWTLFLTKGSWLYVRVHFLSRILNFVAKFALQPVHIPSFSPTPGPLLRALGLDLLEIANVSAHSSHVAALVREACQGVSGKLEGACPIKRDNLFPDLSSQSVPYGNDEFLLQDLLIFKEMPELCSFT